MKLYQIIFLLSTLIIVQCNSHNSSIPTVAFIDAFEDATIAQAKQGFFDALANSGFSEKQHTVNVIYKNAQGNIAALPQIIQYCKSQKVSCIATCPSIATIATVQLVKDIPIFMMVSPKPQLLQLNNNNGTAPLNLFGIGEDIDYIDTSFCLIPTLIRKPALKVGMIFNQSEPQSVDALNKIKQVAQRLQIELIALPVNTSADAQLVTKKLLSQNIDAFFANPDNVVFSSFEVILQQCNAANVPIFTSEAGLVARGAAVAYGADLYSWGYEAGEQAAQFLKTKSTQQLKWQLVKHRKKVYNSKVVQQFSLSVDSSFKKI